MTSLDAALDYVQRGWHVFPIVARTKRPATRNGLLDATLDERAVRGWWAGERHGSSDFGVGIRTGECSGVFVLDVDVADGKQGDETLADLVRMYGELPDTVQSITGSGGTHYVFAWPGFNPGTHAARLGPGLDIRADGGYVVAPPSVHANGQRYAWEVEHDPADVDVLPAPAWLLDLLRVDLNVEALRRAAPPIPATRRPSDDALPSWHELLTDSGATFSGSRRARDGHVYELWTRPGKDAGDGCSATLGYGGSDVLKVHSSAWPGFAAGETSTRLHYFAQQRYGGDHGRARAALHEQYDLAAADALGVDWDAVRRSGLSSTDRLMADLGEHRAQTLSDARAAVDAALPHRPELPNDEFVHGDVFVLDQPERVAARWGDSDTDRILWSVGEALVLVGGPGVGKSTLTANVLRGLLGYAPDVLGLPVLEAKRVLYLALDRPRQIARVMRRLLRDVPRDVLRERLIVRAKPLPADIIADSASILRLAEHVGADVVIVDSLKDICPDPANNEQGGAWNRCAQELAAAGIDLLVLHHLRKRGGGEITQPKSLSEVYGSTWVTAGAGSVVLLFGDPGSALVKLVHLKQPVAEVGPWDVMHEHDGTMHVEDDGVDDLALLRATFSNGLTARQLAAAQTAKADPSKAQIAKATRDLDRLVAHGKATKQGGRRGGAAGENAATYLAVAVTGAITGNHEIDVCPGESNHAPNVIDTAEAITDTAFALVDQSREQSRQSREQSRLVGRPKDVPTVAAARAVNGHQCKRCATTPFGHCIGCGTIPADLLEDSSHSVCGACAAEHDVIDLYRAAHERTA